ncbi:MAG: extracellular solute-binding protein [Treponema sp.]|nr:extracellular solute-binding protein [Treponema sp.]
MKRILAWTFAGVVIAGAWAQTQKIELTVWDFKYDEAAVHPVFQAIDADFEKANPGVVINHLAQPHDNYYEVIRPALASGTGPDVLLLHADQRAVALKNALLPLNDAVASWRGEIPESSWAATSSDGVVYGVPFTNQGIGFYYNKELFAKAGLNPAKAPTEWKDFLAACDALKKAGITPIGAGDASPCFTVDFMLRALVANFYGPAVTGFTKDGKASYTDPQYRQAVAMVDELLKKGYIDPQGASVNYFMDAIDAFKAGKSAIFVGLTSDVAHWKDFEGSLGLGKVGYFPNINAPGMKFHDRQMVQGAGIQWAVNKATAHKDLAVKLVEAYTRGEGARLFMEKTGAIVPNSGIDTSKFSSKILPTILADMNRDGVMDYSVYVPVSVYNGWVKAAELYIVAKSIGPDEFIKQAESGYDQIRN